MFGEIARRKRAAAEHTPAEIRAGVAEERADEHVDHDPLALRQSAQHHRMREREADPVDPEQRQREPADVRSRLQQRQAEDERQRGDGGEQHLCLAAVQRGEQQAGEREEAGEPRRARARIHRVQLVHADDAEHEQADREDQAPFDHEEQRERDRPRRGEQPPVQIGALLAPASTAAPGRRTARRRPIRAGSPAPRAGRGLRGGCEALAISVHRSGVGARRTRRATPRAPRA